jgi:hypothetical protein
MGVATVLGIKFTFLLSLGGLGAFAIAGWLVLRYTRRHFSAPVTLMRYGVALFILGQVVRVAAILAVGPAGVYAGDPYPELAAGIASGLGYVAPPHFPNPGDPTAYFPPGWPFFLAGFYMIFGISATSILAATSIVGVGLVLVIWAITRAILGPGWGLVGANLAVWHPAGILAPLSAGSDLFFAFFGALMLLSGVKLFQTIRSANRWGGISWALILGITGGFGALVRPYGFPMFLSELIIVLLSVRSRLPAALTPVVIAVAASFLFLMPWIIRNVIQFQHPVAVSTNGGVNLWIGNHPGSNLKYQMPPLPEGLSKEVMDRMTEVERDSEYRRAAQAWICDNLVAFLTNGVKKTVLVYATDLSPLSGVSAMAPDRFSRTTLMALTAVVNGYYWLMLGLAAAGWISLLIERNWFLSAMLISAPVIVGGIAFVFFAEGRFHWVTYPTVLTLATVALFRWVEGKRSYESAEATSSYQ